MVKTLLNAGAFLSRYLRNSQILFFDFFWRFEKLEVDDNSFKPPQLRVTLHIFIKIGNLYKNVTKTTQLTDKIHCQLHFSIKQNWHFGRHYHISASTSLSNTKHPPDLQLIPFQRNIQKWSACNRHRYLRKTPTTHITVIKYLLLLLFRIHPNIKMSATRTSSIHCLIIHAIVSTSWPQSIPTR